MANQEEVHQQNMRRKLAARISTGIRTLLERRRNENNSNNSSGQRRRVVTTASERTPPRRRLPRGWWPDQGKREGLKLKAMYDLKDETFVVTEDHIEYVFQEEEDNDPTTTTQYKINLVPPAEISLSQGKQNNRCSNECSICMLEYDTGDVVVCSKYCSHVFHQDCILDWFSHSNIKSGESNRTCPSCRCNFWGVDDNEQNEEEVGGVNSRPRSDTEETVASSFNVEQSTSRGDGMDNENALSPVAED
mmetsp:Transcript_9296/g.15317  ORF Transcript_9296/g.15317 Transcript_9296/m.15317 type:complete len:248 (+) Transcript_9296:202-945(+)